MSTGGIQKVAASNAGNWIPEGWEAGHRFGGGTCWMKKQPIIGAQNRCFQQRRRHRLGPWGNELNIKVLEFNESKEDQMFN